MRQPRQAKALIRVEDERGEALKLPSGSAYPAGSRIKVETRHYRASIATAGYVTGVAAGSFVDTKTGARDLGFGLSIVDFLLEPADPKRAIPAGQYTFGPGDKVHGNIPKRYVEGPQICTRPGGLPPASIAATASRRSRPGITGTSPTLPISGPVPSGSRRSSSPRRSASSSAPTASPPWPSRPRCSSAWTCPATSSTGTGWASTTFI